MVHKNRNLNKILINSLYDIAMTEMERILSKAFWELLEEKPYKKITVKDIVDRCQVNRNTFYYHFDGITTLFEEALIAWEEKILQDPRTVAHPLSCVLPVAEDLMSNRNGVQHLLESKVRDTFFGEISVIAHRAADMYVAKAEAEAADLESSEAGSISPGDAGDAGDAGDVGDTGDTGDAGDAGMPEEIREGGRKLRMYFFRKPVTAADRTILVRFYRSMIEGYITSWIMDGMNTDLKDEVERLLYLLKPEASRTQT